MKKYYDIYRAETGHRKTYLVAPIPNGLDYFATKHFKCSIFDIAMIKGWVKGSYLYLEKPEGNAKEVYVANYERRKQHGKRI